MNETILNFDEKTQEFSVNQSEFDKLDFRKKFIHYKEGLL
jgi:hypothetical protein